MIDVSGDLQENHVRDLTRGIKNTRAHLEPMTVFWIEGSYYVIDGHHRHAAYTRCQYDVPELMMAIPVNEFTGTFHEAKVMSATANTKNKLPMFDPEKRQMAWELLNLGEEYYGTQTNITAITGVTKNTITKYKRLLKECVSKGEDPKQFTLKEVIYNARDGVEYNEDWEDSQAQALATKLRKAWGTIGRSHPEITAKALLQYLGEALSEKVVEDMAHHLAIPLLFDEDDGLVKCLDVPF
jgi:hypothetical protein